MRSGMLENNMMRRCHDDDDHICVRVYTLDSTIDDSVVK